MQQRAPRERAALGRALLAGAVSLGMMGALSDSALADVSMSVEPAVKVVPRGTLFDLSLMIDGVDIMSNFQAYVGFDPEILEFVEAEEGSLYAYTGEWDNTWFFFEEESLGTWEVFDVIFPAGSYIVPPGELAALRFRAIRNGVSAVEYKAASARDINRDPILPLRTEDGLVVVGDATGTAAAAGRCDGWEIGMPFPNPTSGGSTFRIIRPNGEIHGPSRLAVFDVRGRLVRELTPLAFAATQDVSWDGSDDRGREAAPGVYFLRLEATDRVVARKVIVMP